MAKKDKSSRLYIYPFSDRSRSAYDISKALDIRRIRREGSQFVGDEKKIVINWGCGDVSPEVDKCRILNTPRNVRAGANKLSFFKKVGKAARVPPFTNDLKEVTGWLKEGRLVVGRTNLNGRAGTDIVFMDRPAAFVECPLYTLYVKKREEYRVHFFNGKVIDVQRKVLRKQDEDGRDIDPSSIDFRVRNHRNGFIFVRDSAHPANDVLRQAENAFAATGLDFGAIDVIWNESAQKAFVLEVNTAPGLEGTTLENYVSSFKSFL